MRSWKDLIRFSKKDLKRRKDSSGGKSEDVAKHVRGTAGLIEIQRYVSDLLASNMYLLKEGARAIVIDPFEDTSVANGLTVDYILLTHEHYDHISGVNSWKTRTSATVFCSKACADNIRNPRKNLSNLFQEFCELQTWIKLDKIPASDPTYCCTADETFENEITLTWQGHVIDLFEIPGHSMGSIGILVDRKDFFSGDSLMENCEVELRMPGGSKKKWEEIGKKRIATVPDGVKVWPGHFDSFFLQKAEDV
jgi:glyoxylase-like metal-dependent hydrolase (beta-lactamase superfamily II)